jgi:hypothetical protein
MELYCESASVAECPLVVLRPKAFVRTRDYREARTATSDLAEARNRVLRGHGLEAIAWVGLSIGALGTLLTTLL